MRKTTTPELRKRLILGLLKNQDSVSTQEILKVCNASEITIRRDLTILEKKGLLIRTHGGAIRKAVTDQLFTFNHKISRNKNHKDYICKIASRFISANDIIFIDAGSTVAFLSKYISKTVPLTVITNALPLASELINFDNIKLILIGGEVMNKRKAIYGHTAEQSIRQYHANKAFIGTDGISLSKGLTSYDLKEAAITINMAENADEVFLLCDSTKIEKNSCVRFAPLSTIKYLITDNALDPGLISKYEKQHINIINE
ncbi:MAG: DeoR/GlpR family DNA-binding transcription regulator [Bacteroidota bacterium]